MFRIPLDRRIAREADKIASMKEDVDSLSWNRVLEVGTALQGELSDGDRVELGRELTVIARSNLSLMGRLGFTVPGTGVTMPSGMEIAEGGLAEAAAAASSAEPGNAEDACAERVSGDTEVPIDRFAGVRRYVVGRDSPFYTMEDDLEDFFAGLEDAPGEDPAVPAEPEEPAAPEESAEPEEPAAPEESAEPEEPDTPEEPAEPKEAAVHEEAPEPEEPARPAKLETSKLSGGSVRSDGLEEPAESRFFEDSEKSMEPAEPEEPAEPKEAAAHEEAPEPARSDKPAEPQPSKGSAAAGDPSASKRLPTPDVSRFRHVCESRDGSLCLFEDEQGHLVAVRSSRLA